MPLYAYAVVTTAQPVIASNITLTTIPASGSAGVRGKAWDVTNALRPNATVDSINGVSGGRSAAEYAALQTAFAGKVELQWSGSPEYLVDGLEISTSNGDGLSATKTATFTAVIGLYHPLDPTGGAFAANLPAGGASHKGQKIIFKNKSASTNAVTLTPNGVQTIDGAANLVMNVARQKIELTFDGVSDWMVG